MPYRRPGDRSRCASPGCPTANGSPARLRRWVRSGSLLVETLQYALDLGRISSVDDVLLNATGAALAGLLSRRWWARRSAAPERPVAVSATPPA
ncbi:VanZ family protein [Micromonospora vulcania]|uniref:VanZ family protein n=1 Tax=Micromonospora vulcania TaxID=1441873 RepID=A0ABW1HAU0_9ACTN